eukprot:gene11821-8131_t
MQLVSPYLQRPNKGRLPSEKKIVLLNDLCFAVQAVCLIVHIVWTVDASKQTFQHNIIAAQPLQLLPYLSYKVDGCSVSTTMNLYAFRNVSVTVTDRDVLPVLADLAVELRLGIFIGSVALVLGLANRSFVESNVFAVARLRNLIIWKDAFSATELLFLSYMFQIGSMVESPRSLLQVFFRSCGVERDVSLPYVSPIPLYIFGAFGFLTYAVSLVLYLMHTLPKYGVLNAAEIEEYKARLKRSKEMNMETKRKIEEAKLAHARLQFQAIETTLMAEQKLRKRKDDEIVL